jgi:LPS-assembly protein
MIPDSARHLICLTRTPARLAVILTGLLLPLSLAAQDNKPGDCTVNANNATQDCSVADPNQPTTTAVEHPMDWAPIAAVPVELRDRQCINCQGRYMDPLAGQDAGATPPEEQKIHARASSTELREDEVILTGGVQASQGYRRLHADNAIIDREASSAELSGNVTLREPGMLLKGDSAKIFSKTGEATVNTGLFVFHEEHLRGTADTMERDSEGQIHIHNGKYTFCAPGENDWSIKANTLDLDLDEGVATARGATVNAGDIPVFYTPWLRFPLDDRRRTGLLWPDFGNDSSGGLDITAPLYINLAPNYDALYSPRYIEERGINHELKLRYLDPLIGHWTIGGAYMDNDDRYADQVAVKNRSHDRWLGVVKQNGLFEQRWRSRVDYSKASDVDYMRDLETSSLNAQRATSLLQLGSLDYLGDSWLLNLEAQKFQSLADDISDDYQKLPQFTGQYRPSGTPFELEPVFLAQYSNFDTDEDRVTGQRVYAEAGVTYPMLWGYGFLDPQLKYRQLNYDLSDGQFYSDNSPSAGSALASIDGGLIFERSTGFAGKNLLQTLEPRVYYLYAEYDDQIDQPDFDSAELTFTYNQLFRETRFSGRDRLDDANQASLGLTTNFIDTETGKRLFNASLGQIFYFRDRKVRLLPVDPALDESGSEIAGELTFSPNQHFNLRTSLIWDPYSGNMNSGHFQASYMPDNGSIFNIGYAYRRPLTTVFTQPVTEEASISGYFPINNNWSVFASMNYSIEANTSVEDMAGVEYDTCCWTVRLLHLRYYDNVNEFTPDFSNPNLEREHTTQIQFVLKGMGGFGNRITGIMEDMIRGFEDRDY